MHIRMGEALVEAGVLDDEQVRSVLNRQRECGRPFGVLAEEAFGVDPNAIEEAWAVQYARMTATIDPRTAEFCDAARDTVTRRQAWQFRVLPVRNVDGELMVVTTPAHLRRALRFATNVIGLPVFFVMTDALALGEALCRRYPLPGLTPDAVNDSMMDSILAPLVSTQLPRG